VNRARIGIVRMGCGGNAKRTSVCQLQACKSSNDLANCTDPDANSGRDVIFVKLAKYRAKIQFLPLSKHALTLLSGRIVNIVS